VNTIEVFSGTKSFSKVAKEFKHDTFTIDNNKELEPDQCADFLQLPIIDFVNEKWDVAWFSPPCTSFSVSSFSKHFGGGVGKYIPKTEEAKQGLALLERTIRFIAEVKPRYWFIENPRGLMRKLITPLLLKYKIRPYKQVTLSYCQYGEKRQKPTDIWTNCIEWYPKKMCSSGSTCHEYQPRGYSAKKAFNCLGKGTQGLKDAKERGAIPPKLFVEIFKSINKKEGLQEEKIAHNGIPPNSKELGILPTILWRLKT